MSDRILFLRTCGADGSAYDGFRWPLEVGAEVRPEKWSPEPACGNGLHGLKWGAGDYRLLDWTPDAVWIVFSADPADVVDLGGKCKVRVARVERVGDRIAATSYIIANGADAEKCVGGTSTAGDSCTANAGDYGTANAGRDGTATAGHCGTANAGYRGTATAGDYGTATAGYHGTATAGDYGTATAGYRGTATAGDYGTADAGECGTAIAGYRGAAAAGVGGTATAGRLGIVEVAWWDEEKERRRLAIGYVGEDGIKPNVAYRCEVGKLVEVNP